MTIDRRTFLQSAAALALAGCTRLPDRERRRR
jgi:hypothetical protein